MTCVNSKWGCRQCYKWLQNNFNSTAELSIRLARCWPQNKVRCKLFTTDRRTDRQATQWMAMTAHIESSLVTIQRTKTARWFTIRYSKMCRRLSTVQKPTCAGKRLTSVVMADTCFWLLVWKFCANSYDCEGREFENTTKTFTKQTRGAAAQGQQFILLKMKLTYSTGCFFHRVPEQGIFIAYKPASAGKYRDSWRAQGRDKRDTLAFQW